MGFRSTFTSQDYDIEWPQWFRQKYKDLVLFTPHGRGAMSSVGETKFTGGDLPSDIQKSIDWDEFSLNSFVLVFLHECGGITRCQIERDAIKWTEPDEWRTSDGIEHNYCYGCSDANNAVSYSFKV